MAKRPNVVLYISHDTGRFIGPYGYPTLDTPVLDAFARESVVFEQACSTSPLCCPSRSSIVSSLYPHDTGVNGLTTNITGDFDFQAPERHLASIMRNAGYESVVCGPIHEAQNIWNLGFQTSLGGSGTRQNTGGDMRDFAGEIGTWLDSRETDAPFYLQIGSHETHRDWLKGDVQREADRGVWIPPGVIVNEESRAEMAGMQGAVHRMDENIGAILDAIAKRGHAKDTIVVLTTDHGVDMPDSKGTLTDRGLGVFLMIRLPGRAGGGTRVSDLVSQIDVAPTVLELCGIDRPDAMRGASLACYADRRYAPRPVLKDEPAVFSEKTYHDGYDPTRTIRTNDYRYIRYFDVSVLRDIRLDSYRHSHLFANSLHRTVHEELFDLAADPDQLVDLSRDERYHDVLLSMRTRLARWMRETSDPLLDGPIESPLSRATREEFKALSTAP